MAMSQRSSLKLMAFGLTGAVLISAASAAQAARIVELKNMAARVVVEPSAREDVELTVDYGTSKDIPKILVKTSGDKLIADGQLNLKGEAGFDGADSVRLNGGARVAVTDLPVVRVRVPMNVRLSAARGVYVGEIEKASSIYLSLDGQGRWKLTEVEGHADIALEGSETVSSGPVDSINAALGGGSVLTLESAVSLRVAAEDSASATVNSLSGPGQLALSGTSTVIVLEGSTPSLSITNAGSGLARFDGIADEASVSVTGTGQVSLRKVTGSLRKSIEGAGLINIGH